MMTASTMESFSILGAKVYPSRNQVEIEGECVSLEPKVMEVLTCLAHAQGQTVDRDTLMATVWAGVTVEENALRRTISQLRKVLRDDAKAPRFIETIPRKGYRLIAPVRAEPEAQLPEPRITIPEHVEEKKSLPKWGLVAFLAMLVFGMILLRQQAQLVIADQTAHEPPMTLPGTSLEGLEFSPNFSPDGTRMVFSWGVYPKGKGAIYVKDLGQEQRLRLSPEGVGAGFGCWSPDGKSVAFLIYAPDQSEYKSGVYLTSSLSGPIRKLSQDSEDFPRSLDWSRDGKYFVASLQKPNGSKYLALMSGEGGAFQRLTDPGFGSDERPVFSPDGKTILFARNIQDGFGDLYLIKTSGGEVKRLTFDRCLQAGLTWTQDGKHIVFSSNRDGRYRLWTKSLGDDTPRWLANVGAYDPGEVRFNAGGQLAYVEWFFDPNIWVARIDNNKELFDEKRIISSTRWDQDGVFSPKGKRIAFTSNRDGFNGLWVCKADGTGNLKLDGTPTTFVKSPSWSVDGRKLVYAEFETGQGQIKIIDAMGGRPLEVTGKGSYGGNPVLTQQGDNVFFSSLIEGKWQLMIANIESLNIRQLTQMGAYYVQVGPNDDVYYTRHGEKGLFRWTQSEGEGQVVIADLPKFYAGNWRIKGSSLYYPKKGETGFMLMSKDLGSGQEQVHALFEKALPPKQTAFDISADGKTLLLYKLDQLESDINFVKNLSIP